jgi:hypothetical protein
VVHTRPRCPARAHGGPSEAVQVCPLERLALGNTFVSPVANDFVIFGGICLFGGEVVVNKIHLFHTWQMIFHSRT